MADENDNWKNLSFEIDEKGDAKPVQLEEKPEVVVEGETPATPESPEGEEKKRASRTDRLKRQRDREAQGRLEAEARATALEQRLAALEGQTAGATKTTLEVTKKALEDKLTQASQTFQDAFERGDKTALLQAQRAMTEAEIDLRTVGSSLQAIPEKVDVRPTPVQRPQVATPSDATQDFIQENKWFNTDKAMRGFALGLHEQLIEDGVEPESDEYFEAIKKGVLETFGEERMGGAKKAAAPPRKAPPVGSPGNKAPVRSGKVELDQADVKAASRMGVDLVTYAKEKAKIAATGYDPSRRDNDYVTIG